MPEEAAEFETKDVLEASFFMCEDRISLVRPRIEPHRDGGGLTVYFVFSGVSIAEFAEMRRSFVNRKALVEPKMYAASLQEIRNILHDCRRGSR